MTFKMAHGNPERLARAAFRMVTRRLAQGYWPYAYAHFAPADFNRDHDAWLLIVTVKNEVPPKPSDKPAYKFEYVCKDEYVARRAAAIAHSLFLGQMNTADPKAARSKKPQSTKEILAKRKK